MKSLSSPLSRRGRRRRSAEDAVSGLLRSSSCRRVVRSTHGAHAVEAVPRLQLCAAVGCWLACVHVWHATTRGAEMQATGCRGEKRVTHGHISVACGDGSKQCKHGSRLYRRLAPGSGIATLLSLGVCVNAGARSQEMQSSSPSPIGLIATSRTILDLSLIHI